MTAVTAATGARWLGVELSRRSLLAASAVAGAVAATGPVAPARAAASAAAGTTLERTLVRGAAGAGGYRSVVRGPGEPHLLRTDLGGTAAAGRSRRRRPLLAFAQLSDVHVVDAQSPLRVEWSDRLDDPSPLPSTGLFASAYRPHEMLSGQVADAMVRRINQVGCGPVTGEPLALAVQTGDNSDNSQLNEVRWNIDLLDGATVRVDSGDLGRWEGVHDSDRRWWDPAYWHPEGTPAGRGDDRPRRELGFPVVPGLLDAARRPFRAEGLSVPWYAAFGNHDGLAQGNFPASTLQLDLVATGALKLQSLPAGLSPVAVLDALRTGSLASLLSSLALTSGVRLVTPDARRRLLTRREIVEQHFTTTGTPVGHGFTATNRAEGTAYYTFDRGPCRFVVLDTVNPNGYADGSLDQAQFAWLQQVLAASAGRLVLVFSHHTSDTMTNTLVGTGGDLSPRVTGDAVLAELLAHDEVLAWVNGHTHTNQVRPHPRPGGTGGLWEVTTASHIDWPSQARLLEVADNRDGTLSLFATVLDHAGPASGSLDSPVGLAGWARELAANDWHDRDDTHRGAPESRNVELLVPAPASWA